MATRNDKPSWAGIQGIAEEYGNIEHPTSLGRESRAETTANFRLAQNTFIYLLLTTGTDIGTVCCMLGLTPKTMRGYMKMITANQQKENETAPVIPVE